MRLGRRTPNILGARPFRSLPDLELDAVALAQVGDPFAVDRALMEEVLVAGVILDEAKPLVDAQRPDLTCHLSPPWVRNGG
jgi:hypothetical protein